MQPCPASAFNSTTRPWKRSRLWPAELARAFQQLIDEAFADLLAKHKQPVGFKAALEQSVGVKRKPAKSGG
jgi:hypothetical protein